MQAFRRAQIAGLGTFIFLICRTMSLTLPCSTVNFCYFSPTLSLSISSAQLRALGQPSHPRIHPRHAQPAPFHLPSIPSASSQRRALKNTSLTQIDLSCSTVDIGYCVYLKTVTISDICHKVIRFTISENQIKAGK